MPETKIKTVVISFAYNDHRNGSFQGRFSAIEFPGLSVVCARGTDPAIEFIGETLMRVSRRTFAIVGVKEWGGNWCWSGVTMTKAEARRLFKYVASLRKFDRESGDSRMWELWKKFSERAAL